MTEYTEDDFEEYLERLAEPGIYWASIDEVSGACVELANYYAEYTGSTDKVIKATAIYAAIRIGRVNITQKQVSHVTGVPTTTISNNWRHMAELAIRKENLDAIDSSQFLERI